MTGIRIISEPSEKKPFCIIYKDSGLPSCPILNEDKNNALSKAIELFPELKNVNGKKTVEYGLVHRIDTETSGLLLIAATQEFYDLILEEQKNGGFIKHYSAYCDVIADNAEKLGGFSKQGGFIKLNKSNEFLKLRGACDTLSDCNNSINVSSYFRHYGKGNKEVRPVTDGDGKTAISKIGKKVLYSTEIHIEKVINDGADINAKKAFIRASISRGFRHQVRCHLAWIGLPVKGDAIYNSSVRFSDSNGEQHMEMAFFADGLEFTNPVTGVREKIQVDLNN